MGITGAMIFNTLTSPNFNENNPERAKKLAKDFYKLADSLMKGEGEFSRWINKFSPKVAKEKQEIFYYNFRKNQELIRGK